MADPRVRGPGLSPAAGDGANRLRRHHLHQPCQFSDPLSRRGDTDRPDLQRTLLPRLLGRSEARSAAGYRTAGPAAPGHRAAVAQPLRPHGSSQSAGDPAPPRPDFVTTLGNANALRHLGIIATELDWWQDVTLGLPAHHRDARAAFFRPHAVRPQPHAVGWLHDRRPKRAKSCSPATPRTGSHWQDIRSRLGRPGSLCCRSAPTSPAGSWPPRT